jgi:hypothetical protein
MALLIAIGAAVWFVPFLERRTQPLASVPGPAALFSATSFELRAHERACMGSVTLEPHGTLVAFQLRPAAPTPRGGPPMELVLDAPGYRYALKVPGGYPGGGVLLPISPPPRSEIGQACFVNRGASALLLGGTSEDRTISRSPTTIGGRPVRGDVALAFYDSRSRSLIDRLGEAFTHASRLTDGLIPVWLVWALALLVPLAVPTAVVASFYLALREDATG